MRATGEDDQVEWSVQSAGLIKQNGPHVGRSLDCRDVPVRGQIDPLRQNRIVEGVEQVGPMDADTEEIGAEVGIFDRKDLAPGRLDAAVQAVYAGSGPSTRSRNPSLWRTAKPVG